MIAGLVGRTILGITITPLLSGLISFFAIGVAALAILGAAYHSGVSTERGKCEAAALRLKLQAVQRDLKLASDRAARAEHIIRGFVALDAEAQLRIAELAAELAKRPLQSTKPGAKEDPNALVDDRCNYTPAGARRGRGLRK